MRDSWMRAAASVLEEKQIRVDEPMSAHTSFRIGGPADLFLEPRKDQLPPLLAALKETKVPLMILGNGSNLLVGDKGIRGAVIHIGNSMNQIRVSEDRIEAEAGALLVRVARQAQRAGLSGMESLSGIPGSLGGAIMMNAGAYGGTMADVLASVELLTEEGEIRNYSLEEMDFSYRHSRVRDEGGIVLSAILQLTRGDAGEIDAAMADLTRRRTARQPLEMASAGSAFKRPEGYFAGKLIQDAGLRGYRVGQAQVSEKHCGFVVNLGGASAAEVRQLMEDVRARVKEKFHVDLEPEVRFVGEF